MSNPRITGAHLVGSVPVDSEEDCFRALCATLPSQLKRIPDGEPGIRKDFARWQRTLFEKDPRSFSERFNPDAPASIPEDQVDEIVRNLGQLETHYENYAVNSYEIFKRLKNDDVIPANVRFQVCLPTPLTVVYLATHTDLRSKIEPLYEDAMMRSLKAIQNKIPYDELTIQWDAPIEMAMFEETKFYGREADPWFEPRERGILDRFAKLADAVADDVELGIHLCYGDSGHKHFMQPESTHKMVDVSNAILETCRRRVDYIHMPVPKDRKDGAYFEPLRDLKLDNTELILGLAHYDDLEGTKERIEAAGDSVKSFSVSTECGMGRTPREQLNDIVETLAAVSTSTKP